MWPAKWFFGTFAAPSADFVYFAAHKRVWVWHAWFRGSILYFHYINYLLTTTTWIFYSVSSFFVRPAHIGCRCPLTLFYHDSICKTIEHSRIEYPLSDGWCQMAYQVTLEQFHLIGKIWLPFPSHAKHLKNRHMLFSSFLTRGPSTYICHRVDVNKRVQSFNENTRLKGSKTATEVIGDSNRTLIEVKKWILFYFEPILMRATFFGLFSHCLKLD